MSFHVPEGPIPPRASTRHNSAVFRAAQKMFCSRLIAVGNGAVGKGFRLRWTFFAKIILGRWRRVDDLPNRRDRSRILAAKAVI
jgi:hypothetical protein